DEFAIIESSLEVLMQRSVSYRKENEENLAYKRNHLFREWIEGQRDVDDEEWRSHLAQLRIADPAPPYAVALLEIDQYPTFVSRYGQRDQELFKFVLGNVFAETAKTSSLHVWSEWIAPQRLGVVVLPGEAPAQRELHAVCRSVVAWVADNLSFTVTIGIGSTVGSPNEIYMSYSEAREALEYKSVLGGNQAIRSNDTTMQAGEVYKLLPPVRTLSQQFRIGDAAWRGQAEQLFREMQSNLFTRADLSGLASFILYHLHREVADLPDEFQRVWNEETMPRLAGAIERFETVVDLEQGFMAALDDAEAAFAGLRRHRSGHTQMQQVKRYIEDNYANPDMSLSLVGDAFRMRQSNLSRMFKEEFGENFVDYLARLRIERAIEKMRTQAETMQDIAASVGYPHYISFNRVFKKVTGIAPADYRNKLAREGKPE
ncbi:MAG TPA: helix-turn-helix domain-containing protein, partial [Paenibacillus sp.]|nr:helix-turn-helix domain-containing protein [Paenibacillus sp.]